MLTKHTLTWCLSSKLKKVTLSDPITGFIECNFFPLCHFKTNITYEQYVTLH